MYQSPFLLDELAEVNPYFVLLSGGGDHGPGWLPMNALTGQTSEARERLGRIIDDVGIRLGTRRRWIAASIMFQGWAARLTSVYAGSIALGGPVPNLAATHLRFRLGGPTGVELLADPLVAVDADEGWSRLTGGHLDLLADAIRTEVRIARRLLKGNVASALAGSVTSLELGHCASVHWLLEHVWTHAPDVDTYGRWVRTPDGLCYARTTCCGIEQARAGSRCGDCSLTWRSES
jgi:hypothetical protein